MPTAGARVVFGDNHVDFRTHVARAWDGKEFVLAEREALVLKALCEREGEVVSREEILDKVWGRNLLPSTRTIDGFVRRLCERFEPDQENPRHLHTMHGIGYRFTREPEVCR